VLNTDDNGLLEFGSPWYLLADTQSDNVSLIEKAGRETSGPMRIATALLALPNGRDVLESLARRYLDGGQLAKLRGLADTVRSNGRGELADLFTGDVLAAEGRWSEAQAYWARHEGVPFWLRRAQAAFRVGAAEEAVRHFAKVPENERRPDDKIAYALAMAAAGQSEEALRFLADQEFPPHTASAILEPFIAFALSSELKRPDRARLAFLRLEHSLDGLRRCLEVEECQEVVKRLLRWGDVGFAGVDGHRWAMLKQSIFLRITRPLPHYFEGVRGLWLGDQEAAVKAFRTYLRLLPEPDLRSKAHAFLAGGISRSRGKP